jgi:hypothetical protein
MRIEVSGFGHPANRSTLVDYLKLSPYSRALVQGETTHDCISLSLAMQLIAGNGPTSVQTIFNKTLKERAAEFEKLNPDFSFQRVGRRIVKGEAISDKIRLIDKHAPQAKAKAVAKPKAKAKAKPKAKAQAA